jgi:hypothetical protein
MARADHEFIFTAPPSETAASFLIEVNQSSGTTYIDNIAFFEADANNKPVGNNLYTFGDFENNINNIFSYSSNDNHLLQWDTTRKISRTYYFTVSDATGASVNAVAKTTQPAAALVANVTASASTVTVTAAGGTAPYTGTGIFTNVAAGSRTYTVTDANGCSSSGTVTITSARSIVINDHKQLLKAIVYPNPSSSSFDLWLQKPDGIHTTVMVTTAEGKLVYKKEGRKQHFVFGENFHPGLYIVIVQYGTESETIKLIKAK